MKLFKLSDNRYINSAAIIELSLDTGYTTEYTTDYYLEAHLSDGRIITLFSIPKGASVEDAIKQNLIIINKDTDDKPIHTEPTLR
jgi:hypothetical protein